MAIGVEALSGSFLRTFMPGRAKLWRRAVERRNDALTIGRAARAARSTGFVWRLGCAAIALALSSIASSAQDRPACTEDVMLVFDASGSMSGNGWGYGSENPTAVSRIDKVRLALAKVLPGSRGGAG